MYCRYKQIINKITNMDIIFGQQADIKPLKVNLIMFKI